MMAHAYDPNILESRAEGIWVWGYSGINSKNLPHTTTHIHNTHIYIHTHYFAHKTKEKQYINISNHTYIEQNRGNVVYVRYCILHKIIHICKTKYIKY